MLLVTKAFLPGVTLVVVVSVYDTKHFSWLVVTEPPNTTCTLSDVVDNIIIIYELKNATICTCWNVKPPPPPVAVIVTFPVDWSTFIPEPAVICVTTSP